MKDESGNSTANICKPIQKKTEKEACGFQKEGNITELFLNGQTNALHLHIVNGPYYSKSKCRAASRIRWVMNAYLRQEAGDEEFTCFSHTAIGHRPPSLSREEGFLPAQGLDPKCKAILSGHRPLYWVHHSVCALEELKEGCRANLGQAHHKSDAVLTQHTWLSPWAAEEEKRHLSIRKSAWFLGRELRTAKEQGACKYIHYEHLNCNSKVNRSKKGNGRTAALGEELLGRIKKPRTKVILLLALTVLSVVALSTFTCVAMGWARFVHARGDMLTRVQVTHINTVSSKVPWGDKVIKLQQPL